MKSIAQYYSVISTPVGPLTLQASDEALQAVLFEGQPVTGEKKSNHPILKDAEKQLKEYFAGKRKTFDLPLSAEGTEFQKKAWSELKKIPYGKTISYQAQALKLGDAKKARAVGTANSQNPIAIIIPCHRVIAKSGNLSGFGGGVKVKSYLLNLEQGKLPRS